MALMYLGTMGFSYDDWESVFYPEGMFSRNYLKHYSKFFNAVEIDSTFYGTPRLVTVRSWVGVTPQDFKICVKTPRRITHDLMLEDASDEMNGFLKVVQNLGDKLGVILIQFPPSFTLLKFAKRLEEFLYHLRFSLEGGDDLRFAVEFRHFSWYTDFTAEMLRNYRVCWVTTEYPNLPQDINRTSDFLYIRWIGQHGTYMHHDQEREDKTPKLEQWWESIKEQIDDVNAIYGFFNNDYSGHAPATCNRFKSVIGLPTKNLKPPQQTSLF